MKSSTPESAHWRSSNRRTVVPLLRDPLEEGPPRGEQCLPAAGGGASMPRSASSARLHPSPVVRRRDEPSSSAAMRAR